MRALFGIVGFGVAMALRDELTSPLTRALAAGIAGLFLVIALTRAHLSPDRQ